MNAPDAPFFLAVRHGNRQENNIWYMKAPLGKNKIGKFLSKAAESARLQRTGAKVRNRSVRKTSISRLLDANMPENFVVARLSGHKNLHSLQSYKSASAQHQREMSHILSRTPSSCTAQERSLPAPAARSVVEIPLTALPKPSRTQSFAITNTPGDAKQFLPV